MRVFTGIVLSGRIDELLKMRTPFGGSPLMLLGILSMSLQAQVGSVRQIDQVQQEAQQDNECTAATLRGTYGYFFSGSAAGVGPVAAVGLVTFDSVGAVSAKDTLNTNGTIARRSVNGQYQVNSNCTGSASLTANASPFSFDFMVIPGSSGAEFSLIVTNPGAIQTGEAVRIGERECSLANLQGTYRLSGTSFGAANAVGFRVTDGAGNYSGEDTQSIGGVLGHRVGSATYTVNADCTGTRLPSGGNFANGSHFYSVYVGNGTQKFDVRTDAGTISLGMFKKESHRWRNDSLNSSNVPDR